MVVRYFNLKEGKPDVYGGIIKVDTSLPQDKKLEDFISNEEFAYKFRLIGKKGRTIIYEVVDKEAKFGSGGSAPGMPGVAPAGYYHTGRSTNLQVKLSSRGKLEIHKLGKTKFFLSEVSRSKAYDSRQSAGLWELQQHYIVG